MDKNDLLELMYNEIESEDNTLAYKHELKKCFYLIMENEESINLILELAAEYTGDNKQ